MRNLCALSRTHHERERAAQKRRWQIATIDRAEPAPCKVCR
jgi:hypothetical protein